MFVLRYSNDEGATKVKVFERLSEAQRYFYKARQMVNDGEFTNAALFEVQGTTDVRAAADAVKSPPPAGVKVILLEDKLEAATEMQRLLKQLPDLDLDL